MTGELDGMHVSGGWGDQDMAEAYRAGYVAALQVEYPHGSIVIGIEDIADRFGDWVTEYEMETRPPQLGGRPISSDDEPLERGISTHQTPAAQSQGTPADVIEARFKRTALGPLGAAALATIAVDALIAAGYVVQLDVSADQPTWIEAAHAIGEMIADGRYDDLAAADPPSTGERTPVTGCRLTRSGGTPSKTHGLDGFETGYEAAANEIERLREALRATVERIDANESLLVCYRINKRPTEKLFGQLERTKGARDSAVALLAEGPDHGAAGGDQ